MATIEQILRMSATERKAAYKAENIGELTIDGVPFTDYGAFSFLWEKSYVKSPERSGDGSIGNLNSYSTFVTPHLKIDFSLMSIDSYRALMNLIYEKNEFTVTCYDVVHNRRTTNRMYFSTEEMPKLWTIARAINGEEWVELLGVQDYSVEMIGTNASLDTVYILYYNENGELLHSQEAVKGEWVIINYEYTAASGSRFDGEWYKDGITDARVRNGDAIQANIASNEKGEIKLTAVVVPTDQYNLGISYGNGNELPNGDGEETINSITIHRDEYILDALLDAGIDDGIIEKGTGSKIVKYDGQDYAPYEFKGWYWTPVESNAVGAKVTRLTKYGVGNKTMYQIYAPKQYTVKYINGFVIGTAIGMEIGTATIPYGQQVPLITPKADGFTFEGWYFDDIYFQKRFDGIMPPKDITLYAKWVRND